MKSLAILGSTGSIGTQAIDVVRLHPDGFKVVGLTAHSNIELLREQIEMLRPMAVAVMDEAKARELKEHVDIPVHAGLDGVRKIARMPNADTVINALVGSVGVLPTQDALLARKTVALANKETLVTAGEPIMRLSRENNAPIIPIDSEHSAILQCINGESREAIESITLTCSGGPFKEWGIEQMRKATASDALKHPTWKMGAKITIDSATLMNKGFEVIEAHHLYGLPYDKIKVVVHPQSIIHSLVTFEDSSTLAQLGLPDMRVPIQYALSYPARLSYKAPRLELAAQKSLTFSAPDFERFPCLRLAYEAGKMGGVIPAALNAANEVAVAAFLGGKIGFLDIPRIIEECIRRTRQQSNPTIDAILKIDEEVRARASAQIA